MTERRLKYDLVDRLYHQAKEEFGSIFHTLVFLSIYAKDNAVTYVTFYISTATNFPSSLTLFIKLLFYFTVTEMKKTLYIPMQCKSVQIENMYASRSNVLICIFKRLCCFPYRQLQVISSFYI